MTQKHIRENAGYTWWQRAIMQLHEPRIVSAIYGVAYAIVTLAGIISITRDPHHHMTTISSVVTLGGTLGLATILSGTYWVERYATAILLAGGVFYLAALALSPNLAGTHPELHAAAVIVAGFFFGTRYFWTLERPTNPRKRQRADPQR